MSIGDDHRLPLMEDLILLFLWHLSMNAVLRFWESKKSGQEKWTQLVREVKSNQFTGYEGLFKTSF